MIHDLIDERGHDKHNSNFSVHSHFISRMGPLHIHSIEPVVFVPNKLTTLQ